MNLRKVTNKKGTAWILDYYEPDTKKRVMKRFKRKSEAEAVMGMIQVTKNEGRYAQVFKPEPSPATLFKDLAEDYLGIIVAERSVVSKIQIIRDVLLPEFGERPLPEITYRDLELWKKGRELVPTFKKKPRTVARINREMAVMRHMFNKAVAWGMLEFNPFLRGETLFTKEQNARTRYLTPQESVRLLAECSVHLRPIVETAINTGMRKGEILQMRWEWIQGHWVYLPADVCKNKEARPVPLNKAQIQVFKEVRATTELTSSYVFPSIVLSDAPYNTIRKGFEAACRRAGIVNFRFHDLRHTCASWMVMAGASLKAVQEQLGHKTLAMTMRYAHLAPGHQQEAINLIGTRVVKAGSTQKANSKF
jgi:integrase